MATRPLVFVAGEKIGRLTILGQAGKTPHGTITWSCLCDCGNTVSVAGTNLKNRKTLSCGCWRRDQTVTSNIRRTKYSGKSSLFRSAEYRAWAHIKSRCYNPRATGFKYYGGRGIEVCERWLTSFDNFLADMGQRPSANHSIDRIDVDGDYEPRNCRWATKEQQSINRRPYETVRCDQWLIEHNLMPVVDFLYFPPARSRRTCEDRWRPLPKRD